ncbi:MAG: ABC transporter permease, partial [Candidatus Aminicenantes bacterium]|nr:ABC transporter permease [Candidatus Aminicenantes bacterium]
MLKNYLKIFFRNMKRHKGYSFINILGLAVGMACCILILLYVQYELSYDNYHPHSDLTYRILINREGFFDQPFSGSPPHLASALKDNYQEVIYATRVKDEVTSVKNNIQFDQENRFFF